VEYLKTRGVHALYKRGDRFVFCKVDQLHYQAGYDVAVFGIHYDITDETPTSFAGRVCIDLAMPNVGDEIAILGHELIQKDMGSGQYELERRLQVHFGLVTSVTPGRSRMGQSYSFESTIPIRPGLSGSPILKKPEMGGPMTVAGVASFDFSVAEAFESFQIAGTSHGACLWPSLAFGLMAKKDSDSEPAFAPLSVFVEHGTVEAKSPNIETQVTMKPDATEIRYLDKRVNPPIGHLLTIPPTPQVSSEEGATTLLSS
jgi:hypothetical protein